MSRPRVQSCETVPSARPQRTPPSVPQLMDTPKSPAPYHEHPGRYLPGQLGRFPTVGLDAGAIPNTRPDQGRYA